MSDQDKQTSSAQTPTGGVLEEERRRNPRTSARAVVLLSWRDAEGELNDATGVIRNVSAGGFGVRTDRSFDLGQSINVHTSERSLECEVRHVQTHPNSYLVGLEIMSSSDGASRDHSLEGLSSTLAAAILKTDERE